MAQKFISTVDMYKSKNRDRKRRGAAPVGCMVAIVQMLSVAALLVLGLSLIF